MNDNSTISWMIMGGPRYDEHGEADFDHRRALREQLAERQRTGSRGRIARLVARLDGWTARPAAALTADYCSVDGCSAA